MKMKKLTLFSILIILTAFGYSQKVALHSSSGVQFYTGTSALINAYNAASAGDTIYLSGGGFTTPGSIDKQLRIYGAGHYPDSTVTTGKTNIIGTTTLLENADGFYLEGVELGSLVFSNNNAVNNVIVKHCKITGDVNFVGNMSNPCSNFTLARSIVTGGLTFSNVLNAGVFNCIVQGRTTSYGNLFENNIFLFSYTGSTTYYTTTGDNNLFKNNIFLNLSNRYFNGVSNQIYKNLFATTPNYSTTPIVSSPDDNYYPVALADIFVSQTGNTFDYTHNYHLQNPSGYLGTDGKEVGIYGGYYGYKEGAVPSNPHFVTKTISPTTDENGLLNIKIQVSAQEN